MRSGSRSPTGPRARSGWPGRISDPSERFSIDGSWLLDDDGRLYLFRCLDFVAEDDPPHGTGIVVQPMRDPLTPSGPPQVVLRAHSPWQVFEHERTMPLYGGRRFADLDDDRGPGPGQAGRAVLTAATAAATYTGAYGTGEAVADVAARALIRTSAGREGPLFGTIPGLVEGPGHFSVVRPDLVHDWIVLHGRRPGEPGRRVWLCPASWGADGRDHRRADRPAAAGAPPADRPRRFDGPAGGRPPGWRFEPDDSGWRCDGEGLRHELRRRCRRGRSAVAWRDGRRPVGRLGRSRSTSGSPRADAAAAGLAIRSGGGIWRVLIDPVAARCAVVVGATGTRRESPAPDAGRRAVRPGRVPRAGGPARGGRAEVRVDGVVLCRRPGRPRRARPSSA